MAEQDLYAIPDPMIGQQIGRYVIRRKLAEGGMGAVYVANHERLENVTKVVKILLPVYAKHPILRDRFEREALAVSRLRHKHIVTIDDYGQLPDGQLFLMMPFLQGRSLEAYLRERGKLTEHFALHVLVQVCSALQYMHDAGVVHRDIKPANIFLVEDEDNPYRVYLIDLGIAKSLTEGEGVTLTGAVMGTPAYMAVEQYEDAGAVTPLADLYAVAIVAWEMVTTRLPWGMHSTHVLYNKQKAERPPRPIEMSAEWYAILSSALSVHPDDRPQSMRALAVALASAVPALPPHVPSGAEILAKLAKTFVQHAPPSAETVRNASNQERLAPIVWPHRETRPPASPESHPPLPSPLAARMPGGGPQTRTQAPPTTLSASNGIATAGPASNTSRLPVIAIMVALSIGGLVTYIFVHRDGPRAARPVEASAFGAPRDSSADDSDPADASAPDAPDAPRDAPAAPAGMIIDANALPPRNTRPLDGGRGSADKKTMPAPKAVIPQRGTLTRSTRPRSGSDGDSADTFNRNAAGGDE
jgi:serine/threonine protein kinase